MLYPQERLPWAGHTAHHAMPEVYEAIKRQRIALVFVNTRFQAEFAFQELWRLNDDNLPIALHHGSLAAEQRRKVEAAMAAGAARRGLHLDARPRHRLGRRRPGDPARLAQGRVADGAADRPRQPPAGRAQPRLFVPANRFEMLECQAAREAIAENTLDAEPERDGALSSIDAAT